MSISGSTTSLASVRNSKVVKTVEQVRNDFNPINHYLHNTVTQGMHMSQRKWFKCSEENKATRMGRIEALREKAIRQKKKIAKRVEFMRL